MLIANRGEIARRILRTSHRLGLATVAVYSEADRGACHTLEANEAICIGPASAAESYLNIKALLDGAKLSGADAIHPGYGFLSESAAFAQAVREAGLIFIGPNPRAIASMGSKIEAKKIAQRAGVPLGPAYFGDDRSKLLIEAQKMGLPVLVKASAGGGGRGMRLVTHSDQLEAALASAQREAFQAFGDDQVFLEKYFANTRHIEIQILADQHGQVLTLFERECSAQRRHQKIIEECPSPILSETERQSLSQWAVALAKAIDYDNLGTIEFLYDVDEKRFYFLEMNTRIQVEHPVTEAVTGLDLVEWQIRAARGEQLPFSQADLKMNGHAIEARVYAEEPLRDFSPNSGLILAYQEAALSGVRHDSGIQKGSLVSSHYDALLSKVTAWGRDRKEAKERLVQALSETTILGVATNQNFLKSALLSPTFQSGQYTTKFVGRHLKEEFKPLPLQACRDFAIAGSLWQWWRRRLEASLPPSFPSGWRNNFYAFQKDLYRYGNIGLAIEYRALSRQQFEIRFDGKNFLAELQKAESSYLVCLIDRVSKAFLIAKDGGRLYLHNDFWGMISLDLEPRLKDALPMAGAKGLKPAMPGKILKVLVAKGEKVKRGDGLLVVESMKMETSICADCEATVTDILVQPGDLVGPETDLITLEREVRT